MNDQRYVYLDSEHGYDDNGRYYELFTVGFYDPQGSFVPESDHTTREDAAKRVHYLNGGDK